MPDPRHEVSGVRWRGGRNTSTWTSFHPVSSIYRLPSLPSEHEEDNSESFTTGRESMPFQTWKILKGERGREEGGKGRERERGREGGREEKGETLHPVNAIPKCCHDSTDRLVLRISKCLL